MDIEIAKTTSVRTPRETLEYMPHVTAAQVAAYTNAEYIRISDKKYLSTVVTVDHKNQVIEIDVVEFKE